MFPKPVDFKFTQDAFKFIGVLALIASAGMVFTLVIMVGILSFYFMVLQATIGSVRKENETTTYKVP